jgi:hypothetical protein
MESNNSVTDLVLLPAISKPRLPQVINHRLTSHLILVKVRNVVVLALEGLARGIFAFSGDLANTLGRFEDGADLQAGRARGGSLIGLPEGRGKVVQDGGEGGRGEPGEGELVGGVVAHALKVLVERLLELDCGLLGDMVLRCVGGLAGGAAGLQGLRR